MRWQFSTKYSNIQNSKFSMVFTQLYFGAQHTSVSHQLWGKSESQNDVFVLCLPRSLHLAWWITLHPKSFQLACFPSCTSWQVHHLTRNTFRHPEEWCISHSSCAWKNNTSCLQYTELVSALAFCVFQKLPGIVCHLWYITQIGFLNM